MLAKERGMFRIYQCPRCRNIGFAQVESEECVSRCSLCQGPIVHMPAMQYAATIQEAESYVKEAVAGSKLKPRSAGSLRTIGLKKRVFNIIEALVDMNRGFPVTLDEVLRECTDAGIDTDRATDFIEALLTEGTLSGDKLGMKPAGRPS